MKPPAVVVEGLETQLSLVKNGVAQHVLCEGAVVVVGHLNQRKING